MKMFKKFSLVNEVDIPYGISTQVSNTISEIYAHMKEFDYKYFVNTLFDNIYHNITDTICNITIKWDSKNICVLLDYLVSIDYAIEFSEDKFELSLLGCADIKYFKTNGLPVLYHLMITEIELPKKLVGDIRNKISDASIIGVCTDIDRNMCDIVFNDNTFTGDVNNVLQQLVDIIKTEYVPNHELKFTIPNISDNGFNIKLQVLDIDWVLMAEYKIKYDATSNILSCRLMNNKFNFDTPMLSNIKIEKNDFDIWSRDKWQKR